MWAYPRAPPLPRVSATVLPLPGNGSMRSVLAGADAGEIPELLTTDVTPSCAAAVLPEASFSGLSFSAISLPLDNQNLNPVTLPSRVIHLDGRPNRNNAYLTQRNTRLAQQRGQAFGRSAGTLQSRFERLILFEIGERGQHHFRIIASPVIQGSPIIR